MSLTNRALGLSHRAPSGSEFFVARSGLMPGSGSQTCSTSVTRVPLRAFTKSREVQKKPAAPHPPPAPGILVRPACATRYAPRRALWLAELNDERPQTCLAGSRSTTLSANRRPERNRRAQEKMDQLPPTAGHGTSQQSVATISNGSARADPAPQATNSRLQKQPIAHPPSSAISFPLSVFALNSSERSAFSLRGGSYFHFVGQRCAAPATSVVVVVMLRACVVVRPPR